MGVDLGGRGGGDRVERVGVTNVGTVVDTNLVNSLLVIES